MGNTLRSETQEEPIGWQFHFPKKTSLFLQELEEGGEKDEKIIQLKVRRDQLMRIRKPLEMALRVPVHIMIFRIL